MNSNDFYETIREQVSEKEKEYEVELGRYVKNNNTIHVGIVLHKPGSEMMPTIYLDGLYEDYQKGTTIEEIVNHVIETNKKAATTAIHFDRESFFDWKKAKENIYFRLVSQKNNEAYLENGVYTELLDLALVAYYCVHSTDQGMESMPIKQQLMEEHWKVTKEEVLEAAVIHSEELFPPIFQSIEDIINDYLNFDKALDDEKPTFIENLSSVMYVVSNQNGINGASVIAYKGFLEKIHTSLNRNFFVLPSSVHECIIVPETEKHNDPEILQQMVYQINHSHVEMEERLSDSVYYFNGKTLTIAAPAKEE